ncbi:MAG TPA: VIT and VWA domain-containing protein [Drouetiella sp.]
MKLVRSAVATGSVATLLVALSMQGAPTQAISTRRMTQADLERQEALKKHRDGSGTLELIDATGKNLGQAVLQHTDFHASVAGYVNRVKVEQTFSNPYDQTVEAVYTFPLSDTGAVDQMVMKIGSRTITGIIKKKEEARATYEKAKQEGKTAALLDQERPNVFTQSVANIPAHGTVKIQIQYVEYLSFENGTYSLVLPMVVAPRYMPGDKTGKTQGTGWSEDTTRVPDASKISPPVMPKDTRAGHDVSVMVDLDAGVPIQSIESKLHKVEVKRTGEQLAQITLVPSDSIPNRDFVLDWKVATANLQSGYLVHKTGNTGYFSVMLVPPTKPTAAQISPRELNFIIDRSGSQNGLPLQKAKETMLYILDRLNPNDTFQIISFSSDTEKLFDKPELATQRNINDAKFYIADMDANGGTEMRPAVEEATKLPAPEHRLRLFIPMTDGLIGNDNELIGLVQKTRGVSRWFTFGTGDSVNRYLLDGMAKAGGGEAEYVLLKSNGETIAKSFFDKISSPVLTDIKVKVSGNDLTDLEPKVINDVWAQRPVYILGRYKHAGKATLTITGYSAGKPYTHSVNIDRPENDAKNDVLPSIWARKRVDELTDTINMQAPNALPQDAIPAEVKAAKEEVEGLGLEYHILTNYTSFVAVDDSEKHQPATQQIVVPSEAPEGMDMGAVFPGAAPRGRRASHNSTASIVPPPPAAPLTLQAAQAPAKGFNVPAPSPYMMAQSQGNHMRMVKMRGTMTGGYSASDSYLKARTKLSAELLNKLLTTPADSKKILTLELTLSKADEQAIQMIKDIATIEIITKETSKVIVKVPLDLVLSLAKLQFVQHLSEK